MYKIFVFAFFVLFCSTQQQFNVTNSASYGKGATVGFNTLFASLGNPFTPSRCVATEPTKNLCSTTVTLKGTTTEETALLTFVSPFQINVIIPKKFYGDTVEILTNSSFGTMRASFIVGNNPGLFTANGSGSGALSAIQTSDGVEFRSTYKFNDLGVPIPLEVPVVHNGKQNFLVFYGTGLNQNTKAVFIRNNHTHLATVEYSGETYISGLDQVNVKVPSLPTGNWLVSVVSDGVPSNSGIIFIENQNEK